MMIQLNLEYAGRPAMDGQEAEEPGEFVRRLDAFWERVPTTGESITIRGHFIGRVTWVLWPLTRDEDIVLSIEVQPGYESYTPTREELKHAGWNEA